MLSNTDELTRVLEHTFGFKTFRKGQLQAITTLLQHGRLLCIQPTGHGKSLLYQLPATLLPGMTLVISPLLALMRDQLTQLKERFNIQAVSFNTDQSFDENRDAKYAILSGNVRILFIAPEQLESLERMNFLLSLPIDLVVVDEAHCISTWGHDFRPSYRQILNITHALIKKNPDLKLLALTATANKKTEEDIKQQLEVDQFPMKVYRDSMDRPNIRLSVIPVSGTATKLAMLTQLLSTLSGSGLIYCATRENTELVAEYLTSQNIKSAAYHAGIDTLLKRSIQQDFIQDQYTVISATNALGMGIDKPNLRYIIHFDYPGSITAYYQEVGRAGRDGLPADGILLYDTADYKIQSYFIESAKPTPKDFQTVLECFSTSATLDLSTLKRTTGMHTTKLTVVLAELIEQAFLQKTTYQRKQVYQKLKKRHAPNLSRYITQHQIKNHELQAMQRYAEQSKMCLMAFLRKNLGDTEVSDCGQCSHCTATSFKTNKIKDLLLTTLSWLERRTIPIILQKKITHTLAGMAVLDGKARSTDFIYFMRERKAVTTSHLGLSDTLFELIQDCLKDLTQHHRLGCIIPIPSRTWCSRDALTERLAHFLKVPAMLDYLSWSTQPIARQGELLNNEQRQHNVAQKIIAGAAAIPKGTILLLDDYIGSGATLNTAALAIREQIKNPILPFTIAALKWRIGKKGMI